MRNAITLILILFSIFLTACAKKSSVPSSPWVTHAILPGTDWFEAVDNAAFPTRWGHTSIVYNNKIWVIGGDTGYGGVINDVWSSTNGVDWIEATGNAAFTIRAEHTSLSFTNMTGSKPGMEKMWVIAGNNMNDVWYSTNGIDWSEATGNAAFEGRSGHTSLVYNNNMWVIGGISGYTGLMDDVWYSADAVNWTCAVDNAAFGLRDRHSSVVYDNKMWVIGGESTSGFMNDVWYSTNGADWTEATGNAGFTGRFGHKSVVYDNKMWVIGGSGITNALNDVWYSTDGVNWTEATNNAVFKIRRLHTSVVYDNKMWIIGGAPGWGAGYNDAWYSPY